MPGMPESSRLRAWGIPLAFIALISAVLLAIFPTGFPNYDTIYYLLWGREIFEGLSPDYGAPLAPISQLLDRAADELAEISPFSEHGDLRFRRLPNPVPIRCQPARRAPQRCGTSPHTRRGSSSDAFAAGCT